MQQLTRAGLLEKQGEPSPKMTIRVRRAAMGKVSLGTGNLP
jgi:hypothetical protein